MNIAIYKDATGKTIVEAVNIESVGAIQLKSILRVMHEILREIAEEDDAAKLIERER